MGHGLSFAILLFSLTAFLFPPIFAQSDFEIIATNSDVRESGDTVWFDWTLGTTSGSVFYGSGIYSMKLEYCCYNNEPYTVYEQVNVYDGSIHISLPGISSNNYYGPYSAKIIGVYAASDSPYQYVGGGDELFFPVQPTESDVTPPVIKIPENRYLEEDYQKEGQPGLKVSFDVTATDDSGVVSYLSCNPASGFDFPIGTTIVTCTAWDSSHNTSTETFTVTVFTREPIKLASEDIDDRIYAFDYTLDTRISALYNSDEFFKHLIDSDYDGSIQKYVDDVYGVPYLFGHSDAQTDFDYYNHPHPKLKEWFDSRHPNLSIYEYLESVYGGNFIDDSTSSTEEPTVSTNSDGSTTLTYPDGKTVKTYTNGNILTTYPDGKMVTDFVDGHQDIHYPDGRFTRIFDGIKYTTHPDETLTTEYQDGSIKTEYPDGTTSTTIVHEVINIDGTYGSAGITTTEHLDGTFTTKYPINPEIREYLLLNGNPIPPGTVSTVDQEGTNYIKFPDGTLITESIDGTVITTNPDGTIITDDPDDTIVLSEENSVPTTHEDQFVPLNPKDLLPPIITEDNSDSSGTITSVSEVQIPDYLKTNIQWWADGITTDREFVNSVEFLIEAEIIKSPRISINTDHVSDSENLPEDIQVPNWVKTNAEWFAEGKIPATDFSKGLEYLIENKIISSQNIQVVDVVPEPESRHLFLEESSVEYKELTKQIFETQMWNLASFTHLQKITAIVAELAENASDAAWDNYANNKDQDFMKKASDLEAIARSAEREARTVNSILSETRDLTEKIKENAIKAGNHVLDLEADTKEQQNEIESVFDELKDFKDLQDAYKDAKKLQEKANDSLETTWISLDFFDDVPPSLTRFYGNDAKAIEIKQISEISVEYSLGNNHIEISGTVSDTSILYEKTTLTGHEMLGQIEHVAKGSGGSVTMEFDSKTVHLSGAEFESTLEPRSP